MSKPTYVVSIVLMSWLMMQVIHELGHVFGALLTGGQIEKVVLHPLSISRTDTVASRHPGVVVWAGPLIGVVVPCLLAFAFGNKQSSAAIVARFFAGFCLLANGIYIGLGSFEGIGDAGTMRQLGSPVWQLWLFGGATVSAGLWVWHGPKLGYSRLGKVSWPTALASAAITVTFVVIQSILSDRY